MRHIVYTTDVCGDEKNVWFVDGMLNILYEVNLYDKTNKSYIIPYMEKIQHVLYSKIYKIKNEIWMIPYFARRIVIFNIESESFSYIDFSIEQRSFGSLFIDAVIEKEELYLFPCMFDEVLKIDIQKKVICGRYKIPSELRKDFSCGITGTQKIQKDKFMASYVGTMELLELDRITGEFSSHKNDIEFKKESAACMVNIQNKIYIISNHPFDRMLRKMDSKIEQTIKTVKLKEGLAMPYALWHKYIVVEYIKEPYVQVFDEDLNLVHEYKKDFSVNLLHLYSGGVWKQITDKLAVCIDNLQEKLFVYKNGELNPCDYIEIKQDSALLDILLKKWWDIDEEPIKETKLTDCKVFLDVIKEKGSIA